jgi:large subunit ribosomal protein LP0
MEVRKVLQNGSMFDAKVLDLSTKEILASFKKGINNMASLSLGSGYSTSASAPHTLLNGFKNLAAVAAMSGYEFKEATALLNAAKNAPAAGAASSTGAKAAVVVEEVKKEEPETVEMGNLFGDADDEY